MRYRGRLTLVAAAAVGLSLLVGVTLGSGASSLSVSIVSANTAMTSTTNFSTAQAIAACPSGSVLVGGGDELTRSGSPVPNDGAVTLGLNPSDSSGSTAANGAATPSFWTTTAGYSGMAPGLDTITSYAMCASGSFAATVVQVATTATSTLGPVTAACPSGSALVGGGGGYTSFPGSNNTKIFDSFPSDAAGDVPTDGARNATAWTLQGNSNNGTAEPTTAIAICATNTSVGTQVATSTQSATPVTGGSTVTATATCPSGTTLLGGGSVLNDNPSGPGTGGQGVHLIGNYPSDGAGSPASGSAGSWTVIAQDGGQNLTSLSTETIVLCATAPAPSGGSGPSSGGGGDSGGGSTTSPAQAPSTSTTTTTTATTPATPAVVASPSDATTTPQTKTVTLVSGKPGSLTVGAGSEAVTVSWPKNHLGGATLTALPASPKIPGSHGLLATTAALQLVVESEGTPLKHFAEPLDISFPGAAGNVTPAYTEDGNHWFRIPAIGSSSLLSGLGDGYYRDSQGALHILTRHATIFGLLSSGTGLKPAQEPLALGFRLTPAHGKLSILVEATRGGKLTVELRKSGKTVGSLSRTVPAAPRTFQLPVSVNGKLQAVVALKAAGTRVTRTVTLQAR
jgi:hypothetical protein